MRKLWRRCGAIALLALAAASGARAADAYPDRPIHLVIPFPPGGAVDIVGRVIAPKLQAALGQSVIVDNRPGANGTIGVDFVSKAKPDGYTVLLSALGAITIIPHAQKVGYDPLADLVPVTQAVSLTLAWVAKPTHPQATFADVVKTAQGGKMLTAGTSGIGSPNHLAIEELNKMAGTHITHVPYRGEGPALSDLLGGQIDMVVTTVVAAAPFLKSGQIVALSQGGTARADSLPNVPTVAEAGIKGYEADAWQGFFLPAKTPAPIVQRLQAELAKILHDPQTQAFLKDRGTDPVGNSSAEFAAHVRSESERYGQLAKAIDLKMQ